MRRVVTAFVATLFVVGLVLWARLGAERAPPPPRAPAELELRAPLSALLLGAVAHPASAQVQIEQDLALAARLFEGPKQVLFGAGPGSPFVHELAAPDPLPEARRALTELFSRASLVHRYRPPRTHVDAPGTLEAFDLAFGHARAAEPSLPFLYVAGHGERGEVPSEAYITLWGGERFTPSDLAAWLREPEPREPLRLVLTSCYSGAFAEIVFDEADEELGPAPSVHCGLFAATAEDEASGCDPDPDRARQEGFGIHFLGALEGRGRDGAPLERADLDGDGRVSLLEAHAHARASSASVDVPTTTSERFLRYAVLEDAEAPRGDDPIEEFVVASLGSALDLRSRRAAEERLEELRRAFETQVEELEDAVARTDAASARLQISLLEIVPFADDPWNPLWAESVDARARELLDVLERSDEAEAFRVAEAIEATIESGLVRASAEIARVRRLVRAHENLALLGALEGLGGEALERYRAIRACESFTPRLTRPRR